MLKKTVRLSVLLLLIGFPSLPQFEVREVTGDYTLRAEYQNYCSERKTLSKFNSSKHPRIELVVPIE